MSQLQKLYQSIQNFKELGLQLPTELLEKTAQKEEEIISTEILPALEKTITPILGQIQRELVLEIVYIPDEPLSVNMLRTYNSDLIQPAPKIEQVENLSSNRKSFTMRSHKKGPWTGLRVKFPDGTLIHERFAYQTLVESIRKIGSEQVRTLDLYANGVPLVSNTRDDFYNQHDLGNGVLIMTHTATRVKKDLLDEISKRLDLGLEIKIV